MLLQTVEILSLEFLPKRKQSSSPFLRIKNNKYIKTTQLSPSFSKT